MNTNEGLLFPRNAQLKENIEDLVTRTDKVISQLFDRLSRVPRNHSITVVGDENSLCSFDNYDALSAL